jgi:hypothetical protein
MPTRFIETFELTLPVCPTQRRENVSGSFLFHSGPVPTTETHGYAFACSRELTGFDEPSANKVRGRAIIQGEAIRQLAVSLMPTKRSNVGRRCFSPS